ncbi:peptide-methionine (S)-S-oxide reductase, partial [Bacillus pumilus]|uniref:peptide-methionine (S)-S-oxide reductase n=1 Tax=Bacillus pumilus TaxID=1408 RepID=UPI0034D96126
MYSQQIHPTDGGRQLARRAESYHAHIYLHHHHHTKLAHPSKHNLNQSPIFQNPILTQILHPPPFYPPHHYHHHYYKNNKIHYQPYHLPSPTPPFIHSHST